ncbi:MAG: putative membrane protein SpoIIM required for sporulation [Verrucomicrobiales bacterium]
MRTLDSYVLENTSEWQRLEELVELAQKRRRKLQGEELDELLRRYQRASAHLSHVRTTYADPQITARLTRVVAGARAVIYGGQPRAGGAIRTFFAATFPAAVWLARRPIFIAALALILPGVATGFWIANSPSAIEAFADPALREAYINNDFEAYYSSAPAAEFSTQVFLNNINVSFLAFVSGIAWAVPTVLLLVFNGASVGQAAGLFHDAGQATKFWGLILPHGLLELTAIIVAGGAGMQIGWALIVPGDRTRSQALTEQAQRAVSIVIGLILVFILAGLIEGFVTPSPFATWVRISIGAAAFVAFWSYVLALGPSAAANGHTGSIQDSMRVRATDAATTSRLP